MISKIAKATIEKWKGEGLEPAFEDIIKLNALGLKIERSSDVHDFAACPRVAFLGDWVLREPTVGKRAWMDFAMQLLSKDFQTTLYFTAWALNCPDNELPKLDKAKNLIGQVKKFAQEVLVNFTTRQILMAVDYALNGDDQTIGEEYTDEEMEAKRAAAVPPSEVLSNARQLIAEAMSKGMSEDAVNFVTIPQLENMIVCAALANGSDIIKSMKNNAAGAFYSEAGKIHTRLLSERAK